MTANNFKRADQALQDGIAQGGVNLRILQGQPGITPLEGGVPIVVDGKIVGAVGIGRDEQPGRRSRHGGRGGRSGEVTARSAVCRRSAAGLGRRTRHDAQATLTGAQSLNLSVAQQTTSSLRTIFGAQLAPRWTSDCATASPDNCASAGAMNIPTRRVR